MRASSRRWATHTAAVLLAGTALGALPATPASAATRTCTFADFAGSYFTWYANCDGNIAVDAANSRYIRQLTTHSGENHYTLTSAPTTNAVASDGLGEMKAYVGGYSLSFSGDGVSCSNTGGNVYYCSWG